MLVCKLIPICSKNVPMVPHIGTWASQGLLHALRWKLDEVYMCLLLCPSTYLLKIIAILVMEQFNVGWKFMMSSWVPYLICQQHEGNEKMYQQYMLKEQLTSSCFSRIIVGVALHLLQVAWLEKLLTEDQLSRQMSNLFCRCDPLHSGPKISTVPSTSSIQTALCIPCSAAMKTNVPLSIRCW